MSRNQQSDLALLSGILFLPAYYSWGTGIFLFFAFIPLLYIESYLVKTRKTSWKFFWLPFLSFIVFNFGTLWWIKNATYVGMILVVLINTFFMSGVFWLFTVTHRKLGNFIGYTSLIVYWITFEYLYLHGKISFPWLNLGNGFAHDVKLIQWYEYTGTLGGTLWILLINILLYRLIDTFLKIKQIKQTLRTSILVLLLFSVPCVFSLVSYYRYTEKVDPYEIVVLQPNINPYLKFYGIPWETQIDILLNLADSLTTTETDYLVAPETFLNSNVIIDSLKKNPGIIMVKEFAKKHPNTKFIIGATTFRTEKELTNIKQDTGSLFENDNYISYNSALQIDTTENIQCYHKSKLLIGAETMPYSEYFSVLKKLMFSIGGTRSNHGVQEFRDVFISQIDSNRIGPIICFESIYGAYVTDYIKEAGANLLFVITNDGWYKNTPGYKQHNSFASLRAIETRKSIARSANTGISSFINQKGDIIKKIGWWERSSIKTSLNANNIITFYVKHGDYIGQIAFFLSGLLLFSTILLMILKKIF